MKLTLEYTFNIELRLPAYQRRTITLDMKMKIFRLEIIYNDMEYACTNGYPKKQLRVYYSK